jgi:hypothetical protein
MYLVHEARRLGEGDDYALVVPDLRVANGGGLLQL